MKHPLGRSVALLALLAFACASPASTESEKIDPRVQQFVLAEIPADVSNPTFVDFGGKVHLVGWEISPPFSARTEPGSTVRLKLYWRSVKKLGRGYRLYTHLTGPDGKVYEFDDVGPLRETASDSELGKVARLPPSAWRPGMIYVDEQSITVPEAGPMLTLSVGLKRDAYAEDAGAAEKVGEFKLPVLSGVSDGKSGALLGRLDTGQRTGKSKEKDARRRPGLRPGADRRPGFAVGRQATGERPRSDKENPQ
jgi:hypothetical protein